MDPERQLMTTQSRFNSASVSRHYRSLELASRVGEASPHALVMLLYEELLRSLDVLIALASDGATLSNSVHVTKAQSILVALEGSLDFDNGGELAAILARVYRSAGQDLNVALTGNDTAKLTEVRNAVSDIAYAWAALSAV
jgi:flagellar secretion chaperone FliS